MKQTHFPFQRKALIGTIALISIIAIGFMLLQVFESQKPESPARVKEKQKMNVLVKPAYYTHQQTDITSSGQLRSYSEVDVVAEASGKILEGSISLKEGIRFSKGDILVQINNTETRLSLQAQKSSFVASLIRVLPDIQIDFPEDYNKIESFANELSSEKIFPKLPDFSHKKIKVFLASKGILSEYYSIKKMEYTLSKHTITAPFSGTIKTVYNQPGAYMNPGSKIISIIRTDRFEVEVPIEIQKATWIQPGQSVTIISNQLSRSWKGSVERIAYYINPKTQARSVYITTENDGSMISGEYVSVSISGETIQNVLQIPRNAIIEDSCVYTVKQGKLHKQELTIIKSGNDFFLVRGIPEGDSVVIEPLVSAHKNMEVLTYTESN
ncbi:MAG: efflux RND transporter periplasmic adaptor subunit [Bacteroidales bacterium]|jgi:membrane fusion protein (multidrug efflux system)|nr:efflux RND transporter periplasmic adaptor subunit [Bacteroidales bacterium]